MRDDEMKMAAPFIVGGFGLIPFIIGLIMLFKGSRFSAEPLPANETQPDNVDERKRILEMLAEGKITNAEADRLLSESSAENSGRKQPSAVRYRLVINWPRWIAGFVLLLFSFWVFSISLEYISAAAGHPLPFKPGWSFSSVRPHGTSMPAFQSQMIPEAGKRQVVVSIIPILIFPFAIAIVVFWFWMLIDCIRRPVVAFPGLFSSSPEKKGVKVFWLILIFFFHLIPAIIYYFVVYRNPYIPTPSLRT